MNSKQFQFRASPQIQEELAKVWIPTMNTTDNLIRVITAGVKYIQASEFLLTTTPKKGVKNAKHV